MILRFRESEITAILTHRFKGSLSFDNNVCLINNTPAIQQKTVEITINSSPPKYGNAQCNILKSEPIKNKIAAMVAIITMCLYLTFINFYLLIFNHI